MIAIGLLADAETAFAQARQIAQAKAYRQSRVATWLCPVCRTNTRPSRGPAPDVCDVCPAHTPRPAYQGMPRADVRPTAWRDRVRAATVVR